MAEEQPEFASCVVAFLQYVRNAELADNAEGRVVKVQYNSVDGDAGTRKFPEARYRRRYDLFRMQYES